MPITIADVDARLRATNRHAETELARGMAALRIDWLLDMRIERMPRALLDLLLAKRNLELVDRQAG